MSAGDPNIAAIAEKFAPQVVYLYVCDLEAEVDRLTAEINRALAVLPPNYQAHEILAAAVSAGFRSTHTEREER